MAPSTPLSNTTLTPQSESPVDALVQSLLMIIISEIGDKTFLIAAILAMRHPRSVVFAGAFGSLALMSFLSAAMGHVLPSLIPKSWTQAAAGTLFLVFGAKMLVEARAMEGGTGKIREEMREAEEEIEEDDEKDVKGTPMPRDEESAEGDGPSVRGKVGKAPGKSVAEGARNFCSLILGPVFVQAFVLTFLGEWGDRSQIATIALGAAHNVYLVSAGTIVGHGGCTLLAVMGGRYVSTKISVKHVTLGGSILFLLFGVVYLYEAFSLAFPVSTVDDLTIPSPMSFDAADISSS